MHQGPHEYYNDEISIMGDDKYYVGRADLSWLGARHTCLARALYHQKWEVRIFSKKGAPFLKKYEPIFLSIVVKDGD